MGLKKSKPRAITVQDWDAWLGYLLPPLSPPPRPASNLTRGLMSEIRAVYEAELLRAAQGVQFYVR